VSGITDFKKPLATGVLFLIFSAGAAADAKLSVISERDGRVDYPLSSKSRVIQLNVPGWASCKAGAVYHEQNLYGSTTCTSSNGLTVRLECRADALFKFQVSTAYLSSEIAKRDGQQMLMLWCQL